MPEVSIVIPVYNNADLLPRAVESVRAQTHPDWELLLVDDCSTDGSRDVAAQLVAADDRIRALQLASNCGHARARNAGYAEARGELLAVLDADDEWLPEKLALQVAALRAQPRAAWSYHGGWMLDGDGGILSDYAPQPLRQLYFQLMMLNKVYYHSSGLMRREAFQAVGGYATKLRRSPDWDLWLRLAYRFGDNGAVVLPDKLCRYYWHGSNISGDPAVMSRAEALVLRRALLRGLWAARHPVLAWRVLDASADRWRERWAEVDLVRSARSASVCALLAPGRRWKWRRALAAWRAARQDGAPAGGHRSEAARR